MQNSIPKLRQRSIISMNPSFLSEKLKTLTSSNYHRVKYFLLKFRNVFYLTLPIPIPDDEKKEGFMKAFKAFIKPFEAPQRSVKMKI